MGTPYKGCHYHLDPPQIFHNSITAKLIRTHELFAQTPYTNKSNCMGAVYARLPLSNSLNLMKMSLQRETSIVCKQIYVQSNTEEEGTDETSGISNDQ